MGGGAGRAGVCLLMGRRGWRWRGGSGQDCEIMTVLRRCGGMEPRLSARMSAEAGRT
jgi:hypothetical protein